MFCVRIITILLLWLSLIRLNIFADNEILSLVCVKGIKTKAGDTPNIFSVESLSNTLKEINNARIDQNKVKNDLAEYLDPKLIRIEFGTNIASRHELRKNYNIFIDKLDKVCQKINDIEQKTKFEQNRDLRIFSYQILTRDQNIVADGEKNVPFGIEEVPELIQQLLNVKPKLYGKTLELLQLTGMNGNCFGGLPVESVGLQLTDFIDVCLTLNKNIKNEDLLTSFKKSCGLVNAKIDIESQIQKFSYVQDFSGKKLNVEEEVKAVGGIPKNTFEKIRDSLEDYTFEVKDDLKINAKIIYLNSEWSLAFVPIIEPLLQDDGLLISVLSNPNDLDASTDITGKLYLKEDIQSTDIIKAFFDSYQFSSMHVVNSNNGFCPYFILKKKLGRLIINYFLDPKLADFVQGFENRNKAKQEDIMLKDKFPGLQDFNEKYNKDNNQLLERLFVWYCCWHKPVNNDVIKQATSEALKLKSLFDFMHERNIYFKQHNTFEEFQTAALNLFVIK